MTQPALTPEEAREIAAEGFIYFYPLVTMDLTRRVMTNSAPSTMRGPANMFIHVRAYPTADMKDVVRPNFDTLYSSGWLDLTEEPVIVSTADTHGRYFMLPMIDMWTDVFAVPGKRTNGTDAADFAVVGPGWNSQLPAGVQRVDAPTPHAWIIGRTQTNGPADYDAVHAVQDGYRITRLSEWGKNTTVPPTRIDPDVDMKTPPLVQVNAMPAARYFSYSADLLKANPPHPTDWSQLARLKRLGIEPGRDFDAGKLEPVLKAAVEQGAADGLKKMQALIPKLGRQVNGWGVMSQGIGVYGAAYEQRATIAMIGLGANQPEDAIYPMLDADADGRQLTGDQRYVLHFDKAGLPPVNAFWSVTMYDAEGAQVGNPLNRFAIGDRDALRYNADGSLDFYIQHADPGGERTANWLPAPASGVLGVTMRLYAPKPAILDGTWSPPPVVRAA